MRILIWLWRALVFFILFAFALNNQQLVGVRWFFGYEWRAPMVFIVLTAFALGCAFGVFAMVPTWWKHRRVARHKLPAEFGNDKDMPANLKPTADPELHPPRDGL